MNPAFGRCASVLIVLLISSRAGAQPDELDNELRVLATQPDARDDSARMTTLDQFADTALSTKEKGSQARGIHEQQLLGIASGLALVALFVWSRLRLTRSKNAQISEARQRLVESERQREVEEIRTRIARDVHADISGDIAKIAMLGADVKHEMIRDTEAAGMKLERIEQLARDVGRSLQDIVWAVDPTQDSARALVDRARAHTERMLGDARIPATLLFEHTGPDVVLDPSTRRDILLLLKGALDNTLAHAHASRSEVSLRTGPAGFELHVRDDGKGFDPSIARGEGNGLGNMEARAERLGATWTITSVPGRGTEVTAKGVWVGEHVGMSA